LFIDRHDLIHYVAGLLWLAVGLTMVFFFGLTLQVDCTRVGPTQVNCSLQKMWLRVLPVGAPRTITHLQRAISTTTYVYDDWVTTLDLVGRDTTLRVPPGYLTESMGVDAETRLQAFVASQEGEMKMVFGGWVGQALAITSAFGCFILPAVWALYRKAARALKTRMASRSGMRSQQIR
jgi:hypothetical protein